MNNDVDLDLYNLFFEPSDSDTIIEPGSEDEQAYNASAAAGEARRAEREAQRAQEVKSASDNEPEQLIVDGQEEVGTIIEFNGKQWRVTRCEYNSDDSYQPEYEEERMSIGWHSWVTEVRHEEAPNVSH